MPDYFPPNRQSRQRRRTTWIVVGILAILAVVFVAFPSSLSPGKHPDQSVNGPSTTLALSHVVSTYEAVVSQYQAALAPPNAVIANATNDLAKQEARAQSDAASYSAHESGSACAGNALNPGLYQSCLTSEQQTAASVLSDENVANDAAKADVSRQVAGVQQIEAAITAFTQQLAGIPWPSSDSAAVSSLTACSGQLRRCLCADRHRPDQRQAHLHRQRRDCRGRIGGGHPAGQHGHDPGHSPAVIAPDQLSSYEPGGLRSLNWAPAGSATVARRP